MHRKKSLAALKFFSESEEGEEKQQQVFLETNNANNPESSAESSMIKLHVNKALQSLTPRERSVFILRHYNELQLKEIAEILKITTGTVKSTLFRAIKKLQKKLSFYRNDLGLEDLS